MNGDLFVTWTKGREVLPNDLGTLNDYRNMPNWIVQLNVDFQPLKKWIVIFHNTLSDSWKKRLFPFAPETMEELNLPTQTEGYYTMDMINRFRINRNFHAFLIINNLFNAEYGGIDAYGGPFDLNYNPQYKRNFRLGFSFTME
jgi:hemoglobin/transferrin/lactoferrin receptor protein